MVAGTRLVGGWFWLRCRAGHDARTDGHTAYTAPADRDVENVHRRRGHGITKASAALIGVTSIAADLAAIGAWTLPNGAGGPGSVGLTISATGTAVAVSVIAITSGRLFARMCDPGSSVAMPGR
ncbi:MAG: hypothetical protein M0007_14310 [Actinomycetota bacterium]|jgi:hypothetical protein|nr:hypothetical protein [Actinomycetota bacterium]